MSNDDATEFDEEAWNSDRVALESALICAAESLASFMGTHHYTIPFGIGQVIKVRPDEE